MTEDAETTRMSTAESTSASWTQRAEDRASGGGGGRMVAWLVTPFVAVVPWLVMAGGVLLLLHAARSIQISFQPAWGALVGGTLVVLVAALLWAALTAWSSVGTVVAGLCTVAAGLATATRPGIEVVSRLGIEGPVRLQSLLYGFATPYVLVPLGALLIAGGLGAAGARRLGRRRG